MIILENELLRIGIITKGAELQHIFHKENNIEYLWQGDAAYWGKRSPVLFPVVGGLKDNIYYHKDQAYTLSRHGFARDMEFELSDRDSSRAVFTLTSNLATLQKYPFDFTFSILYEIKDDVLSVTYSVSNTGDDTMYFSVGGHPAFNVPLIPGTAYTDYYLKFNQKETTGRWLLSPEGLIEKKSQPLLHDSDRLTLHKDLFASDAIVLKNIHADRVSLLSGKHAHGLHFHFPGFPYLGIWAAKGADFVCIEPWCGIADSVDASGLLADKEGIESLPAAAQFRRSWSVQLF